METVELNEVNLKEEDKYKIELNTGIQALDRVEIASGLSKTIANSYLLMLKTHLYHWNVKGDLFYTIHKMTEEQYNDLFSAIDDLAERMRALGAGAPGTLEEFSKLAFVKDGKMNSTEKEMIGDLLKDHEQLVRLMREVVPVADKAGDEVTVDLLTQRLTIHEKYAWMWRSFLEK
ncbi:Dps family protein [Flexithrix dorotheae]|uniref:Dps family protein n=1 Tax=Flexithrix dorotheae TaxID=70993 RepID=UPI00036A656A|nr:Dps family protein [Flexithrix dorotheae]